jgi:N-hydroxyarylamine O-acetyltransferase
MRTARLLMPAVSAALLTTVWVGSSPLEHAVCHVLRHRRQLERWYSGRIMTPKLDLDAYFARIGYTGPHSATLDTLAEIHLRHAVTIPFENLNPLLRWPVRLDVQSLEQKLVRDGRGGYCFEQNGLLGHVLERLGFGVRRLAARVLWNAPAGTVTPRTHMVLLAETRDARYVVDVGFGGQTPTAPLLLQAGVVQRTGHEPYRLAGSEGFTMQSRVGDEWRTLYQFDLQEQFPVDYEVANWYTSTHPASTFVTRLVAARADAGCRYVLRGNELAVHRPDGGTERRTLTGAAALRDALEATFLIRLPGAPELDAALERVAAGAA